MEKIVDKKAFAELLNIKSRSFAYTRHSIKRARKREVINENEETVPRFEKDLYEAGPYLVIEQDSEYAHERKFKLYYRSQEGGFIAYILVLNDQVRLISVYRTSKKIQEAAYKCELAMRKKH